MRTRDLLRAMPLWIAAALAGCGGSETPRPAATAETLTVELGRGVTLRLVRIPPGSFQMGSPEGEEGRGTSEARHQVTLTHAFYLGVTEVTQAQWYTVMQGHAYTGEGSDRPIEGIPWNEAAAFCRLLSRKTGDTYRLPTEAEWEYACRAGSAEARYAPLDEVAWHEGNSGGESHGVGAKAANRFGLHDTLGNVWEWCSDRHGAYDVQAGGLTDPAGPATGELRVARGGAWNRVASYCRASMRFAVQPSERLDHFGLRVARTP